MNSKKNLAVCIPSGRAVDFGFFSSFSNALPRILIGWNTAVLTVSSPYISENRNELVRKALKVEESTPNFLFDCLLWLDTDMVFSFEQVQKLLQHLDSGKDIVSGLYYNPYKGALRPVAYRKSGDGYEWLSEKDVSDSGIVEVDAVGFGFCAMKMEAARKVFERYKPRPFALRFLDNGSMVGEDQVFCERAKELGYGIMLDSDLVVKHAKGMLPP